MVKTVDQALDTIDRELSLELGRLPRWTFARALLVEARRTGGEFATFERGRLGEMIDLNLPKPGPRGPYRSN